MVKTLEGCKKWLDRQLEEFGERHTKRKDVNEMFFKIMFVDCHMSKEDVKELKKYIKLKTV